MARSRSAPTRDEWVAVTSSAELIRPFLFSFERQAVGQPAQRKLRLIACAAARCLFRRLPDDACREAVEVGERFADGRATKAERDAAFKRVSAGREQFERSAGIEDEVDVHLMPKKERARVSRTLSGYEIAFQTVKPNLTFTGLSGVCYTLPGLLLPAAEYERGYAAEHGYQFAFDRVNDPLPPLIRDILGFPFAPLSFPKKWRTETVRLLAEGITIEGKFDRLPILADALEEAGCDNTDALAHCRGDGPHARGCWVVDLVRGVHWQPKV